MPTVHHGDRIHAHARAHEHARVRAHAHAHERARVREHALSAARQGAYGARGAQAAAVHWMLQQGRP